MIDRLRKQLDRDLADFRAATSAVRDERKALKEAGANLQATLDAQALLQETAADVQNVVHKRIAGVVTRCLQAIWGDDAYAFKLEFKQARGRTEATIRLVRDGNEVDPLDGAGGGCCDVVSWGLRLAALMLARPKLRRLVCADEPFRHLDAGRRPAARAMLLALSKELGFQFIISTHSKEIAVGKVVEIGA